MLRPNHVPLAAPPTATAGPPRRHESDEPKQGGSARPEPFPNPTLGAPATGYRVPKGGGAHGWASMHCPQWIGGCCQREGLPDDVSERVECPLVDWCQGVGRCGYFEHELLPKAPPEVRADYRRRTTRPRAARMSGTRRLTPARPKAPPQGEHADTESVPAGTLAEEASLAAGRVLERLCPRCGVEPLLPRRRLCDECRKAARRRAWRQQKRRQRAPCGASYIRGFQRPIELPILPRI